MKTLHLLSLLATLVLSSASSFADPGTLRCQVGTFDDGTKVVRLVGRDATNKQRLLYITRDLTSGEVNAKLSECGEIIAAATKAQTLTKYTDYGFSPEAMSCSAAQSNTGVRRAYLDYVGREPNMSINLRHSEALWISGAIGQVISQNDALTSCNQVIGYLKKMKEYSILN